MDIFLQTKAQLHFSMCETGHSLYVFVTLLFRQANNIYISHIPLDIYITLVVFGSPRLKDNKSRQYA